MWGGFSRGVIFLFCVIKLKNFSGRGGGGALGGVRFGVGVFLGVVVVVVVVWFVVVVSLFGFEIC